MKFYHWLWCTCWRIWISIYLKCNSDVNLKWRKTSLRLTSVSRELSSYLTKVDSLTSKLNSVTGIVLVIEYLCPVWFVLHQLVGFCYRYKDKTVNCVISVAYYLVQNNSCGDNVDIIIDRLLKLSVRACKLKRWQIYVTVIQVSNTFLCSSLIFKFYAKLWPLIFHPRYRVFTI